MFNGQGVRLIAEALHDFTVVYKDAVTMSMVESTWSHSDFALSAPKT